MSILSSVSARSVVLKYTTGRATLSSVNGQTNVESGSDAQSVEARSRDTILREAARLVTLEGIEGVSIARLAGAVGLSKSGLFAHFRSKEELQLATIDAADEIFRNEVIGPALDAPPGIMRLRALCDAFLAHLERDVFPGGCFFASVAAEIDTRPGPVRERALASVEDWFGQLETATRDAQAEGSVSADEDPTQIAFELDAFLLLANAEYVASGDPATFDRAREAIARVLRSVAP
jgi:AcrR family transcriptional regulator